MATTAKTNVSHGRHARAESESVESSAADAPPSALARRLARTGDSWVSQAATSGLILAVLLHLRFGYSAGGSYQLLLAQVGLRWAHPDWFAGDWALANVPQPHWLYDVITWVGAETGALAAVYLVYWLAAMAVFGVATSLLARTWVPRHSWLAVVLVTVCAAVLPPALLGTGSPLVAAALPGVLGGVLLYLTVAAVLADDLRIAVAAGVATALVHVQDGMIVVLLIGGVALALFLRSRHVNRLLVRIACVSLAVVVVTLVARPVAGHVSDFAEVCRTLIPNQCEASTWPRVEFRSGFALVGLALLTVLYMPRERRLTWLVLVALPAVALLGGAAADRVNLPVLGSLAQGLYVYMFGAVLLPLVAWGALTPIFADLSNRQRWLALAVVLTLGLAAIVGGHWALDENVDAVGPPWLAIMAGLMVVACMALTVPDFRRPTFVFRGALAALTVSVLVSSAFGTLSLGRSFDPRFGLHNQDLEAWGAQVQLVVPAGSVIIVPPFPTVLRMATKRAVLVDCQYVPHGGHAWQEYQARLNAIGGLEQCTMSARVTPYGDLTAAELTETARRYNVHYLVIETAQEWRSRALVDAGWAVVVPPRGTAAFKLLVAPST